MPTPIEVEEDSLDIKVYCMNPVCENTKEMQYTTFMEKGKLKIIATCYGCMHQVNVVVGK